MPFISGGELYKVVKKRTILDEATTKFYITQIVVGIGKLHERGIIHRDLKLENLLLDKNGYIKIIDFGLAKMLQEDEETKTYCGTLEYFAPEMIKRTGHDKAVDWWAIGVLIFEMVFGVTPFYNRNRNVLISKIKHSRIVFPNKQTYNLNYSNELVSIILKLLDKDKDRRLGSTNDAEEILAHPWFNDMDIGALESFQVPAPIIPTQTEGEFDTQYFNVRSDPRDLVETVLPPSVI